ncbi:hypothetical protein Trydic_g10583, partial [Trypoxylus dichotomus]
KSLGKRPQPNAPVEEKGQWFFKDEEKAEVMANFLEKQFRCGDTTDKRTRDRVQENWDTVKRWNTVEPELTSLEELEGEIRRLASKKAPGADGIPNRAIKLMGSEKKKELVRLINACLETSYFPDRWKEAVIITIPKGEKDPAKPENRRPISLLCGFGKLAEKIIKSRIVRHVEEKGILSHHQFGFRQELGAVQQALNLVEDIRKRLNNKKVAMAAFLDVEKAYDKVWRKGVISKMRESPIPTYLVKITQEWLEGRRYRVKTNDKFSQERTAEEGLPQGSPLSPVLFNIFISDLPRVIAEAEVRLFQFADDTAVVTQGRNAEDCSKKMASSLEAVGKYMRKWNIKVNEGKTEVVQFGKRRPVLEGQSWGRKRVRIKRSGTYLGVTLDSKLSLELHTQRRGAVGRKKIGRFYPILRRESGLPNKVRRKIFKTIALPACCYGEEIWEVFQHTLVHQKFRNYEGAAIIGPGRTSGATKERGDPTDGEPSFGRDQAAGERLGVRQPKSTINNEESVSRPLPHPIAMEVGDPQDTVLITRGLKRQQTPRYAAIEHIQSKTTNSQSTVSTKLLCSKSKVAPVRVIPMLELCAALVLAQLIDKMKTALKCHIQRYYWWSDSSVVLH